MTYYLFDFDSDSWKECTLIEQGSEYDISSFMLLDGSIIETSHLSYRLLSVVQYNIRRLNDTLNDLKSDMYTEYNWRESISVLDRLYYIGKNSQKLYVVGFKDNDLIMCRTLQNKLIYIHYENKNLIPEHITK